MHTIGAGGCCVDIFPGCHFYFPCPVLWETAQYRLKYCLKEPLNQSKIPKGFCQPETSKYTTGSAEDGWMTWVIVSGVFDSISIISRQ